MSVTSSLPFSLARSLLCIILHCYTQDDNGYIEDVELLAFLKDLLQNKHRVSLKVFEKFCLLFSDFQSFFIYALIFFIEGLEDFSSSNLTLHNSIW